MAILPTFSVPPEARGAPPEASTVPANRMSPVAPPRVLELICSVPPLLHTGRLAISRLIEVGAIWILADAPFSRNCEPFSAMRVSLIRLMVPPSRIEPVA